MFIHNFLWAPRKIQEAGQVAARSPFIKKADELLHPHTVIAIKNCYFAMLTSLSIITLISSPSLAW